MSQINSYFAITKSEVQEDGSLMVYGKASDDSVDMDNQICDDNWLKTAMPAWMQWGNIREQHSAVAAGVATEYENKADGHYIGVKVVDPNSVKKVEAKVLKGFSVGIKNARVIKDDIAKNGRIIGGDIVEISLVDRPANSNAKLTLAKSLNGNLSQTEEYKEFKAPLPSEVFKTQKGSKMNKLNQIAELAKSLTATTVKFSDDHKTAFDQAKQGLTQLIALEAAEQAAGSDESYDISTLANALDYLSSWAWSERYESVEGNELELAATTDINKSDEPEVPAVEPVVETPAEVVVEVPVVEVPAVEEPVVEVPVVEETTPEVSAPVVEVEAEKSVTALELENVSLKEKALKLETELAEALNKAVAGGPKRTATQVSKETLNDNLFKAWDFKSKADAATDSFTAQGYRENSEKYFKLAGITDQEKETNV